MNTLDNAASKMEDQFIPLSVPELRGNEWAYIKECLDTNWVSYAGSFVDRFEKKLAAKAQTTHAVAVASGTAALHIALLLAGVGQDDEVIMPGITFVSPANAVRYLGAWPVFVDIRESDWQMNVDKLAGFLEEECYVHQGQLFNRVTKRRIAAILPVHLLGGMLDVDAVAALAAKHELPLIEDAAECLGATYKGRPIGAPLSIETPLRLVTTSFNGNKIVTTGGGGAILANDETLAAQAKHLTTTAKKDKIAFFHDQVGYNYRLTNIAAALGVAQLEQLDEYVTIKRAIAQRYAQAFEDDNRIMPHKEPANCRSTFWMYTILLDRPSRPLVDQLNQGNIMSRPVWYPIYRLPAFKDQCYAYRCGFSETFHQRALSIPCSVGLGQDQQARVINTLLGSLTA